MTIKVTRQTLEQIIKESGLGDSTQIEEIF